MRGLCLGEGCGELRLSGSLGLAWEVRAGAGSIVGPVAVISCILDVDYYCYCYVSTVKSIQ